MTRWRVSQVLLLIVLVLCNYETSLISQTIPTDPRTVSFETLECEPPSAEPPSCYGRARVPIDPPQRGPRP